MSGMTNEEYDRYYNDVISPYLKRCWDNPLNIDLLAEYQKMSTTLKAAAPAIVSKLSCPFLCLLGPDYKDDYSGTFIIGRETKKCENAKHNIFSYQDFCDFAPSDNDDCREKIMMETQAEYVVNNFGGNNRGFFNVAPKIAGCKGIDFLDSNFVWDELIAVAYKKDTYRKAPSGHSEIISFSKAKLEMELKLAKPKYAIFLIGDYYEGTTSKHEYTQMFGNVQMKPTVCHDVKTCDLYGTKCFVTIHPCNRTTTKKDIWKFLAEEIKK